MIKSSTVTPLIFFAVSLQILLNFPVKVAPTSIIEISLPRIAKHKLIRIRFCCEFRSLGTARWTVIVTTRPKIDRPQQIYVRIFNPLASGRGAFWYGEYNAAKFVKWFETQVVLPFSSDSW